MKRTNSAFGRLAAWASIAAASAPAFASEGGEPGGVFAGDVGNALWTLVIFGAVVFVLGKFAWPNIHGGLLEREKFIRQSLLDAKRDREEAEARLKEYVEKLQSARAEATAIVDEGRRDAEEVKRKILEEGQREATAALDRAKREISIARETAIKDLYAVAATLATGAAAKIVKKELSAKDHERLIAESITEMGERFGRKSA
jgi:F-type H+-transporting ATPase subunit b